MGGAIVAAFLEESEQADTVSKIVLDAPMLSLGETIAWNARDAMPVIGGAVPAPVLWAAEQITSLRYGVDWSKVDYLDDTSWLKVPTLVTHGTADERVPVTVARSVKAAAPDLVTLEEFPDAQHTEASNSDPDRWGEVVDAFLAAD
jgi:alpha-beta hydrolase superfamily lysophospholipase